MLQRGGKARQMRLGGRDDSNSAANRAMDIGVTLYPSQSRGQSSSSSSPAGQAWVPKPYSILVGWTDATSHGKFEEAASFSIDVTRFCGEAKKERRIEVSVCIFSSAGLSSCDQGPWLTPA